jgi:mannose-1-phosphate guanylyltransferase
MNSKNYCVIMAGGVGSRFWPLSRSSRPKQFLDILGTGKTLLQQTFDRFSQVIPSENIYIVSNADYEELILEQLPGINKHQVLLEPSRKNTAPCIAYASHKIFQRDPSANMVVAPSDHLITKEEEFLRVVSAGLDFTASRNALLTLGIKPSRPETGYGYIQANGDKHTVGDKDIRKVKTFTEKPDYDMAKVFFESGEFFWNSGIFIWSMDSIMNAFENLMPELNTLFVEGASFYGTDEEKVFIADAYPKCKSQSIDYGLMEKADNVYVLCSDFGWSDLGTWGSLYTHSAHDDAGNAIKGKNVFAYNLKNCQVNVPDDKLVVVHGLEDFILVESDNILLICKKHDEQRIKDFVNDVRINKGDSFV